MWCIKRDGSGRGRIGNKEVRFMFNCFLYVVGEGELRGEGEGERWKGRKGEDMKDKTIMKKEN